MEPGEAGMREEIGGTMTEGGDAVGVEEGEGVAEDTGEVCIERI